MDIYNIENVYIEKEALFKSEENLILILVFNDYGYILV